LGLRLHVQRNGRVKFKSIAHNAVHESPSVSALIRQPIDPSLGCATVCPVTHSLRALRLDLALASALLVELRD
jgi:hypothetical protein